MIVYFQQWVFQLVWQRESRVFGACWCWWVHVVRCKAFLNLRRVNTEHFLALLLHSLLYLASAWYTVNRSWLLFTSMNLWLLNEDKVLPVEEYQKEENSDELQTNNRSSMNSTILRRRLWIMGWTWFIQWVFTLLVLSYFIQITLIAFYYTRYRVFGYAWTSTDYYIVQLWHSFSPIFPLLVYYSSCVLVTTTVTLFHEPISPSSPLLLSHFPYLSLYNPLVTAFPSITSPINDLVIRPTATR